MAMIATLLHAACAATSAGQTTPQRHWLWDLSLEHTIGQTGGIEFGLPLLLTAIPDGGFVLADRSDGQIRAFDGSGVERWRFGREGDGPGEFRSFVDIELERNGNIMVLDPDLGRITVLSGAGELEETIPVRDPVSRLLPSFRQATVSVVPRSDRHIWASITRDGTTAELAPLPHGITFPAPIVGESYTAASERGAVVN